MELIRYRRDENEKLLNSKKTAKNQVRFVLYFFFYAIICSSSKLLLNIALKCCVAIELIEIALRLFAQLC